MPSALLEHRLRQAWTQRGPLARALWPLSPLYGALAARQRQSSRAQAQRLPVPVVVIGNVIAGGAGKTPTTLAVVQHLQARGWRPGIISRRYSRGHGRSSSNAHHDGREVTPDAQPADVGDEPLLLRQRTQAPVFVAPRRVDAAHALLAAWPDTDVLVCDDGLQHLALARDVEVVVFDARGIGNGWLLPAGPLREPWPRQLGPRKPGTPPCPPGRALADAPTELLLRTESEGTALPLPAGAVLHTAARALAPHALRADGTSVPLTTLQGQPLAAVAGIARPEAFFDMLRAAGLTLAHTDARPDHYDFKSYSCPPIKQKTLICTEKDAAKLWPHQPDALAVPLLLHVPAAFFAALDEALATRGYHPRTATTTPAPAPNRS
ncbi:tetraacyldisaccharide 4'-kinase [Ottowia sp.]|uniref:tetraacyldisaccharide 4'-kinase n=1 Tax=Ottowia sp. TaxID=1898956 RepID=UPI003A8887AD